MSSDVVIRVAGLGKCYTIYERPQHRLLQMLVRNRKQYYREFWALKDISFEVRRGEVVGVIGRNGSGKSTLLQLVCGTLSPTRGSIETTGRVAALLELGSGFNPDFTGRENVYLNGAVLGLSTGEIDNRFDEIAAFADIGRFIEQPVKTYSSGMLVRLAFAVSVCVEPDILVVDEALAVGDMGFQQKCLQRLADLRESGATVLLVTHDIMMTRNYCSRVIYLDDGVLRREGDAETVGEAYLKDMFARDQAHGDGTAVEWRAGTGKIGFGSALGRITAVGLSGPAAAGAVFRRRQGMTVRVRAEIAMSVEHPQLIVQLRDARGYVLYGIASTPDCLGRTVSGDRMAIAAEVDLVLNLGPGNYAVTAGLNDRLGETLVTLLDKVVAACHFSIAADESARFHGCVDLDGLWKPAPSTIAAQDAVHA